MWAGVIFWFSSQSALPSLQISALDYVSRKLAHISVYFVLFLLVYRAIILQKLAPAKSWKAYLLATLVCIVYAASDEVHQLSVPGRFGTLRDIGFDFIGVFIGFLRKTDQI